MNLPLPLRPLQIPHRLSGDEPNKQRREFEGERSKLVHGKLKSKYRNLFKEYFQFHEFVVSRIFSSQVRSEASHTNHHDHCSHSYETTSIIQPNLLSNGYHSCSVFGRSLVRPMVQTRAILAENIRPSP